MAKVQNTGPGYGFSPGTSRSEQNKKEETLWLREGDQTEADRGDASEWAIHRDTAPKSTEQEPPAWIEEEEKVDPLRKLIGLISREEADELERAVMESRESGLVRDDIDRMF